MLDIDLGSIHSSVAGATSGTALLDGVALNTFLDNALAEMRKAVAREIPGFDVGAIQMHSAGADMYFISVLPSALHRPSIYSNHRLHGSKHNTGAYKNGTYISYSDKYTEGLEDIIALKHFGSGGGETDAPINRRRGYWASKGVWILPRWTIASYFLWDVVKRLNVQMQALGLPGVVTVGDKYS